jgi:glycosyltransferase involved in cell wall biosynthesis
MRILVTASSIAPTAGGLRTGVLAICEGLVSRGHDVTLFTTDADFETISPTSLKAKTTPRGFELVVFRAQVVRWSNIISFDLMRALKKQVPTSDLVLIHSPYQISSTVAAHYCRKHKVPYVLRPHGTLDPFLVNRRRRLLKWTYINLLEKRNFRGAAAVQYSSQTEADMTREFIDEKSPELIIPEGINIDCFDDLPPHGTFRTRFPETQDKRLLLYLGRIHQKKGLELLADAFAEVAQDFANVHLVIAGTGEREYVDRIAQMLRNRQLSARVTMTGQLSDEMKLAVLRDAEIFVLPSYGENFGIAVVEAMACGLPVLITDKVGIWHDVADYEAGVVTQCDAGRIAKALGKLLGDSVSSRSIGQRGRRLVKRKFTVSSMAKMMDDAYTRLCGTSR